MDDRIDALRRYHILDTPEEPAFDEIVRTAASLCRAPMSAVNFLDRQRQWSKAQVGLNAIEIPIGASICAHAIAQDDILVVPDATRDDRFKDNPLVVGSPAVRSYAGVPLRTPDGHRIGTLCIIDRVPRAFDDIHKGLLQSLGRHVMAELELRRTLAAEHKSRLLAERLLAEKTQLLANNDLLLREIDHRVKNSLQMVSSMLSLQARRTGDDEASVALDEAQKRVAAIAAVHDQLYRAAASGSIDMATFLEGLCVSIADNKPDNVLALRVRADSLILESGQAMRIGLLVNELVTNSFKHAFPDERQGSIEVSLHVDEDNIRLSVSDDGIGLPKGFNIKSGRGLGMRVIRAAVLQFGGTLSILSDPGTGLVIDIPRTRPFR